MAAVATHVTLECDGQVAGYALRNPIQLFSSADPGWLIKGNHCVKVLSNLQTKQQAKPNPGCATRDLRDFLDE